MNRWLLASIVLTLLSCYVTGEDAPGKNPATVTIKQGRLDGVVLESRKGDKYFGFYGVPYAKAPVRFGLPQPPDSWEGVRKATKMPPHCFQYCLMEQRLVGVEDCLTLNIYTKKLDGNAPVMVHIHGGGFQFGSSNFHHAKYLIDENVVLVMIQYRLGALGFLNTGDDEVPGNMGLKDQSAALRWVKDNIKDFGGDPEKVSIYGYSAGGASVHYHVLSPMSKGLFRNAISQSGTALCPWAQQPKPKELAGRLATSLSCNRDSSQEMVKCLRNKTPAEIVNAQLKFSKFAHEYDVISMLFSPSVEMGQAEPKFMSDTSYNTIKNGKTASKVPWLTGLTTEEGAFYIAPIVENKRLTEKLDADWYKMAPNILYYENTATPTTQSRVSGKVREFYFGKEKITQEKYVELGRVYGDRFFTSGITRAIKEHARAPEHPVYPYIFNYSSPHSIQQGIFHTEKSYGIGHAEDLKFQFNKTYGAPDYDLDTIEGQFSEKFNKLFVSFAKDGKPTATWGSEQSWEPFHLTGEGDNESPIPWYVIDEDTKILDEDIFKPRTDFWESLPLREDDRVDIPEEKDEL